MYKFVKEVTEELNKLINTPKKGQEERSYKIREMLRNIDLCQSCGEVDVMVSTDKDMCGDCNKQWDLRIKIKAKLNNIIKDIRDARLEATNIFSKRKEDIGNALEAQGEETATLLHILMEEGVLYVDRIGEVWQEVPDGDGSGLNTPHYWVHYNDRKGLKQRARVYCRIDGSVQIWLYDEHLQPTVPFKTNADIASFIKEYVGLK